MTTPFGSPRAWKHPFWPEDDLLLLGDHWVYRAYDPKTGEYTARALLPTVAAMLLLTFGHSLPECESSWAGKGGDDLYRWRGMWVLAYEGEVEPGGSVGLITKELSDADAAVWFVQNEYHLSDADAATSWFLAPGELTERARTADYLFVRSGDCWQIRYGSEVGTLPHLYGLAYIAELLRTPGKAIPAVDLSNPVPRASRTVYHFSEAASGEEVGGNQPRPRTLVFGDEVGTDTHSEQPTLDRQALLDCHRRLQEIRAELDRARRDQNLAEVQRLERQQKQILNEVRASQGLFGKPRPLGPGSQAVQARQAVYQAIRRAYKRLRGQKPPLGKLADHLEASISTEGNAVLYNPTGPAPPWVLDL